MDKAEHNNVPAVVTDYIDAIIKKMRYRKTVRAEVRRELADHFADALADCNNDDERNAQAQAMIEEFGDAKLLGVLLRRAKKRCRPLWRTMVVRMFQAVGVILLLCILHIGYLAVGRPTISVDYSQWLNETVRAGRDESLNAYPDYQEAIERMTEMPSDIETIFNYTRDQEKTPQDWLAIEAFLETETEAIEAFRRGAAKPFYWNIYQAPNVDEDQMLSGVVGNLIPQINGYKQMVQRVMEFQIPLDIHKGRIKQAANDCIALHRFGRHILSQGVAIEQVVGVAIQSVAMSAIYDLLDQVDVSDEDLLSILKTVQEDYQPDTAPMDWTLEKAFWYDMVQRSFTDDGEGSGRPLLRGTIMGIRSPSDFLKGLIVGFPNRKELIDSIEDAFAHFDAIRQITPHQWQYVKESDKLLQVDQLMFMQEISEPAFRRIIEISWRVRASQAGLLGTLAILRFKKENGRLPEDWAEVFDKGYLHSLPMDPYSDAPLVYKKTEDGFMLYSIGMDLTDDGGVPGTGTDGKPRQFAEKGDWIFWPVSERE